MHQDVLCKREVGGEGVQDGGCLNKRKKGNDLIHFPCESSITFPFLLWLHDLTVAVFFNMTICFYLVVLTLNDVHVVLIFSFSQLIKPEGQFVHAWKISSALDVSVPFQLL
jgi:hypothetical protein